MIKTLVIQANNESFTITGSEEKVASFIRWAAEYKRGSYDGFDKIICTSSRSLMSCRLKAIREGLLKEVSLDEIKTKYKSV